VEGQDVSTHTAVYQRVVTAFGKEREAATQPPTGA
jgi:hypothetical protein